MNLRKEMAGAVRSVRYDMAKRDPNQADASPADGGPDATYTGMSTFGAQALRAQPFGAPSIAEADAVEPVRPPRRVRAVAAFGALAVAGAAGSYFAVVNGLGTLLSGESAAPDPYPIAIGDTHGGSADGGTLAANAGMGHGTAARPGGAPGAAATAVRPATARAVRVPEKRPAPKLPAPPRTAAQQPGTPASQDCDCNAPPVPTPTVPSWTTPSDLGSTSPSPSVTTSGAASGEPTPSGSTAEPDEPDGDEPVVRWRDHRRH